MDKSRNSEFNINPVKQGLIAIEKNENILEKTKSLYVKRSLLSNRHIDNPFERIEKRKQYIYNNVKKYTSLNFNNFSLVKSKSTSTLDSKNLPIVSKCQNPYIKKDLYQPLQKLNPKIHELFLTAKIKDNSTLNQIQEANNKCLMYIEDLLNKKKNENINLKNKTSNDFFKESEREQRFLFYDQEFPANYRDLLKESFFQMNLRPKKQEKYFHPSLVKIKYSDELLKTISRKLNFYNQNNLFLGEEEVANLINDEIEGYINKNNFSKMNTCNTNTKTDKTFTKKTNSFALKDIDIDSKVIFPKQSPDLFCKEIIEHKKHMQNKLLKKELNKSEDDKTMKFRECISSIFLKKKLPETGRELDIERSLPNQLSPIFNKNEDQKKIVLLSPNKKDDSEVSKDYISINEALKLFVTKSNKTPLGYHLKDKQSLLMNGNSTSTNDHINVYPHDRIEVYKRLPAAKHQHKDEDYVNINHINRNPVIIPNEIQDTLRTLDKLEPKGIVDIKSVRNGDLTPLNQLKLNSPSKYTNFKDKRRQNKSKEQSIRINKKFIEMKEKRSISTLKKSLNQEQIKEDDIKSIFANTANATKNKSHKYISKRSNTLKNIKNLKNDKSSPSNKSEVQLQNMMVIEQLKKQKECEDIEKQRLKKEKELNEKKVIEEEILKLEKERKEQLNRDYQRYVQRKNAEEEERKKQQEEKKEEPSKPPEEDKEKESFFGFLNLGNQDSLLSKLQPKKQIKKNMILVRHSIVLPNFDVSLLNKKKNPEEHDHAKEQELFESRFLIKKENEEEKIKKRDLFKLKQEINYLFDNTNNIDDKYGRTNNAIDFFKEKIKSLRNNSDQTYLQYLENNFEEIQEELKNIKENREEENRINSFIKNMEYSLNNTQERKKFLHSHFKILDSRCSYSASNLLH